MIVPKSYLHLLEGTRPPPCGGGPQTSSMMIASDALLATRYSLLAAWRGIMDGAIGGWGVVSIPSLLGQAGSVVWAGGGRRV